MIEWHVGAVDVLRSIRRVRLSHSRELIQMHRLLGIGNQVMMSDDARFWGSGGTAAEVQDRSSRP
jgi:hypothetical protein